MRIFPLAAVRVISIFAIAACLRAAPAPPKLTENYGKLPLSFEANRGQFDSQVRFAARSRGLAVFLTGREAVLVPPKAQPVRMRLIDSARPRAIEGADPLPGRVNYLRGSDPARWRRGIPTFGRIRYSGVYRGIDLVYYGNARQLEYDFVVAPGANPRSIRLEFAGAKSLKLRDDELILETAGGDLRFRKPAAYQQKAGAREPVAARYKLLAGNRVAFEVGRYDRTRPLTIDPVLVYATFLGGSSTDSAVAIATDSAGNAYIAGNTSSTDFPTVGPVQATLKGYQSVFVTKLNPSGTALVYSTYIGGSGSESARGIAVDDNGEAYVVGSTFSTDFPAVNPAYPFPTVGQPGFAFHLNSSGDALVYSTSLLQAGPAAIAVIPSTGDAFIANSSGSGFPATPGAYLMSQPYWGSGPLIKLSSTGAVGYATYLHGQLSSIAVDTPGNVYVTGSGACAQNPPFPTTPGAYKTTTATCDSFVTKLNPAGSALVYSTFLSGTTAYGKAIAVDASGNAYVAGYTSAADYPVTPGAWQTAVGGSTQAFLLKLNAAGSQAIYSTYLGPASSVGNLGLAIDSSGNAYILGSTSSDSFPLVSALQTQRTTSNSVLFRTSDGGATWVRSDNGLTPMGFYPEGEGISPISIDPVTPSKMLLANNGLLYRSTDGGNNWTQAPNVQAGTLARSPSNPNIVYAGTWPGYSVYRSADSGASFSAPAGAPSGLFNSLAVDPLNPDRYYSVGNSGVAVDRWPYSSWNYLPAPASEAFLDAHAMAIDPRNPNILFVGGLSGLYKSTDGGHTWAQKLFVNRSQQYGIVYAPSAPDTLYAFGNGITDAALCKSTDNGETWRTLPTPTFSVATLAVAPADPNTLYAGAVSGAYVSTDAGLTWNPAGNLRAFVVGLAVHPTDPNTAYGATAGSSDSFLTKLTPDGSSAVYSTYLGGFWLALATSHGDAFVAGRSGGPAVTPGSFQTVANGPDATIARVSEATPACTYQVLPLAQTMHLMGGRAYVSVVSPSGCAWTASSPAGWVAVTSDSPSSGVGVVTLRIAPNPGAPRSATLTIAGQDVTISQSDPTGSPVPVVYPPRPASGSGATQSFDLAFTDSDGWQALGVLSLLINSSLDGSHACYLTYDAPANLLSLVDDAGHAAGPFAGSMTLNGAGAIGNSQCTVNLSKSYARRSDRYIELILEITFSPSFAGDKTLYLAARDTGVQDSGWQAFGTWNVPVHLWFIPVAPCRIADTRRAAGPFGGPTMNASERSFAIPQSACGIPGAAQAYSLNVTAVPQGPLNYLTLWPTGQVRPVASTLNSWDGRVVANAAIVPAGSDGAVSVYASDRTDVILDINGYFDSSAGANAYPFYTATPCRIADTRNAAGAFGGPSLAGGQTRDFPVPASSCGMPSAATAYSMNATVVPQGLLNYLTMWPAGQAQPLVSTLNSWTGTVVANAALVPAGTSGSVSVYVSDPTDVILDANGYFAPPGSSGALSFYPVAPCRVADTRNAVGAFGGPAMGASDTRFFTVPSSSCGIPTSASAYSLNVTVLPSAPLNFLTIWPAGQARPSVSTLNSWDGAVAANAAIVPADSSGAINVYVSDPTHLILDINGYFAP